MITKNIDALAYNGIILDKFYTANMCSPSRASLLTGKFPLNTGEVFFVLLLLYAMLSVITEWIGFYYLFE